MSLRTVGEADNQMTYNYKKIGTIPHFSALMPHMTSPFPYQDHCNAPSDSAKATSEACSDKVIPIYSTAADGDRKYCDDMVLGSGDESLLPHEGNKLGAVSYPSVESPGNPESPESMSGPASAQGATTWKKTTRQPRMVDGAGQAATARDSQTRSSKFRGVTRHRFDPCCLPPGAVDVRGQCSLPNLQSASLSSVEEINIVSIARLHYDRMACAWKRLTGRYEAHLWDSSVARVRVNNKGRARGKQV